MMRNWYDILPAYVARRQIAWERYSIVYRARERNRGRHEIARALGVSTKNVDWMRILGRKIRQSGRTAPVAFELSMTAHMVDLAVLAQARSFNAGRAEAVRKEAQRTLSRRRDIGALQNALESLLHAEMRRAS